MTSEIVIIFWLDLLTIIFPKDWLFDKDWLFSLDLLLTILPKDWLFDLKIWLNSNYSFSLFLEGGWLKGTVEFRYFPTSGLKNEPDL